MLLWPWTVLASGENYKPSQETLHGNEFICVDLALHGNLVHGRCSAFELGTTSLHGRCSVCGEDCSLSVVWAHGPA